MEIIKSNCPEGCSLYTWLEAIALIEYFDRTGIYGYKSITDAVMRNRPDINKDILPSAWETKEATITIMNITKTKLQRNPNKLI